MTGVHRGESNGRCCHRYGGVGRPRWYCGSATLWPTSLFLVKLTTDLFSSSSTPRRPSCFFSHNNMAGSPSIPGVAPNAPKMKPAVPVLTVAAVNRLPTSLLRPSPLREVSHSAPTSVIEKMTQSDEGEEPKAASDAGRRSKYPVSSFSVSTGYGRLGSCSATYLDICISICFSISLSICSNSKGVYSGFTRAFAGCICLSTWLGICLGRHFLGTSVATHFF